MKRWMAALDAACARINRVLVVVALVLALLDVAAAAQRWTALHPAAQASARTVAVAVRAEPCAQALPPELRDMVGRD